jgi:hypothetical protein
MNEDVHIPEPASSFLSTMIARDICFTTSKLNLNHPMRLQPYYAPVVGY